MVAASDNVDSAKPMGIDTKMLNFTISAVIAYIGGYISSKYKDAVAFIAL